MKELVERIHNFINTYAGISPMWEEDSDEDVIQKYTGPDPYQLLDVAYSLNHGLEPFYPHSSWESGCYKPYTSKEGRKEHDEILMEIKKYI